MTNKSNKTYSLNDAVNAVKTYKEKIDEARNCGTLEEQVYLLFGGWKWEDNTNDYSSASLKLLSELAKPDFQAIIHQQIGNYHYGNLVEMLSNMVEFCYFMQKGNFEAMFLLHELEEYPEKLKERFGHIVIEYSRRAEGITSYQERKEMLENQL